MPKDLKTDYWISQIVYSIAIGWRTKAFGDKKPAGWAAFWDTKNFPGQRSMRRHPIYNLEAALIADGVPMDKLYPIDVDRAFKKLEELKPHVLVWWNSGAQSAQILQDGEVDMVGAWNGRIQAAMKEKDDQGRPARHHLRPADAGIGLLAHSEGRTQQGPRHEGHRHHDAPGGARRASPSYINYAPANLAAFETGVISKELAAQLPNSPENIGKGFCAERRLVGQELRRDGEALRRVRAEVGATCSGIESARVSGAGRTGGRKCRRRRMADAEAERGN